MAVGSASSAQSASGGLWAQIQLQQAQRNADQAEQQAAALKAKADAAQTVADRAQENARSLKVQSGQAQEDASQARLNLASQNAVGEIQNKLTDLGEQISKVLEPETLATYTAAATSVVTSTAQQTGTLVNVTA